MNSNGGTFYFGIDNHGNVVGVDSADQIGNSIANTLQGVPPKADKFVKINVFAKLGLIEKYGIGIPRIFASYENEYKEPLLECTDDMVCITLPKLSLSTEEASLSERQKAILSYIRKNQPVTRSVVQQAFVLSYGTTTSELNKLVGDGLILKVGNGRSTKHAAN